MASKGRKQTWHVLLSALAGALGGFSQSYMRTKERQEDAALKEDELAYKLEKDLRDFDAQEKHREALRGFREREVSVKEQLGKRGLSEEEMELSRKLGILDEKGMLPNSMEKGQQRPQQGAPQGPPAKPGIPSVFEEGIKKAMEGVLQPQRSGMQPPPPQQAPQQPPQQAPQPQGRTMQDAANRRTGMAPPQQPQLGRMAQVTPQDEEFARMPGMASTDQDRMQAMNLSRAYEVAMNDSYPMEERAMAWVALNQIMGIPVPEPLLAYLRTGITPSQNQTPQQARTMGVA